MLTIELTGTNTATCGRVSVTHKVSPICKLARKLISNGADFHEHVKIMRGETECFERMSLGAWASLTTIENDRVSVRQAPYVPFSATAVGQEGTISE